MGIKVLNDTVTNDGSFTVPSTSTYRVLYGSASITASENTGDRQVEIRINDGTNDVWWNVAGNVLTAGDAVEYQFTPGFSREISLFDSTVMTVAFPQDAILGPGFVLQVVENNNVDSVSDALVLNFVVDARPLTFKGNSQETPDGY